MQTVIQVVFVLLSAVIIGSALKVVTARNIVHAALWLISSFCGVGALYLLLESEFMAIVQVLIYVGAISILMLFAIMLTRHVTGEGSESRLYQHWWVGLIIAASLFAAVLVPTLANHNWESAVERQANADPPLAMATSVDLGKAFLQEYLLPFEVAAVLLLVGLVGAIVIAFGERSERRHVMTLAEEVAQRKQQQAKSQALEEKG